MNSGQKISLATLGRGAAIEVFDFEFQRVLDNIQDVNTDAKAVREINLKVKIKPDESRDLGDVSIQASSKTAPVKPYRTRLFMGADRDGRGEAFESDPNQGSLFQDQGQDPDTTPDPDINQDPETAIETNHQGRANAIPIDQAREGSRQS